MTMIPMVSIFILGTLFHMCGGIYTSRLYRYMFRALAAILLGFAALLAALSLPLWQFDLHFGIVYALCVAVTIGLALATERVIAWFHNVNQMLKRNQRCGVLIGE